MAFWSDRGCYAVWSSALLVLTCMGCTGEIGPSQESQTGGADSQGVVPSLDSGAQSDTLANAKHDPTAVSGVRKLYRVQTHGSVVVKLDDLSALTVGAWVPNAAGTGYDYREGTGHPNGTFVIPGVEHTPYLLQYGGNYYWMNSRTPDMSTYQLGRPDTVAASPDTLLHVELSGLTPWQSNQDDVLLHSMGAGLGYGSLRTCGDSFEEPEEGASSLSSDADYTTFMSNCGNTPAWRIDPSQGDIVHAVQEGYRSSTDSGLPTALDLYEVRRAAQLSVTPGVSSIGLSGTLEALPTTQQQIDFRASQFESVLLAAHPSGQLSYEYVDIGTLARFQDFGVYAGFPDLAAAYNFNPGQGNYVVKLEYGNPFPSRWSRPLISGASILVPFSVTQADGTPSNAAYYSARAMTQEVLKEGVVQTATARVGAPREPRINGMDATGSVSGTGTTPLLSWSAPGLGTANWYQVQLFELHATSSGDTARVFKGSFYTPQTQLRLPSGILVAGKSYFVQMTAYDIPALRPEAPFLTGPDYRSAARFSGVFQP